MRDGGREGRVFGMVRWEARGKGGGAMRGEGKSRGRRGIRGVPG